MIYPSIDDLTKGKFNRYELVVATAKCARIVTDEYVQQRAQAEKMIANKETDKSLASMIKTEFRDEKAVKKRHQPAECRRICHCADSRGRLTGEPGRPRG